jgi:hypothetical protein
MAACTACGEKAGFGKSLCGDCERQQAAQREAELANMRAQQQAQFEQAVASGLADWKSRAQGMIKSGAAPVVYKNVYVPVNSVVTNETVAEFDMRMLQVAGLEGWKIEGIIPRTIGLGLTNKAMNGLETWGAGVGGNIVGVYVIMSRAVVDMNSDAGAMAEEMAVELLEAGYEI